MLASLSTSAGLQPWAMAAHLCIAVVGGVDLIKHQDWLGRKNTIVSFFSLT
jgi:hypothetical protein